VSQYDIEQDGAVEEVSARADAETTEAPADPTPDEVSEVSAEVAEPVAEEPVAEEPAAEEPAVEDDAPAEDEPVAEEPAPDAEPEAADETEAAPAEE
jgi:hypothetical protein